MAIFIAMTAAKHVACDSTAIYRDIGAVHVGGITTPVHVGDRSIALVDDIDHGNTHHVTSIAAAVDITTYNRLMALHIVANGDNRITGDNSCATFTGTEDIL